MTRLDDGLWLAAACCVAAIAMLGYRVARGATPWVDGCEPHLFGRMTPVAALFTKSGYARNIAAVSLLAVIVAIVQHMLLPVTIVILVQVLSQLAVVAIKDAVRRRRPAEWRFRQEPGTSYPSGHATTAVAFYGGWLFLIAVSGMPAVPKDAALVLLALWIAGICWSRVALGAHHPSDVLAGALVGAAFLSAELTLLDRIRIP